MSRKMLLKKVKICLWAAAVMAVMAAVGLIVWFYPDIRQLMTEENRQKLQRFLESFGWAGAVVLFFLQLLQVAVAVIPAEPIEVAAGMGYGAWVGTIICLAGVLVGSALVFSLVKRFGQPVVHFLKRRDRKHRLDFFQDSKRLETVVFIIYLIPAMPKDVLTYMAALTPIGCRSFLLISTIARMPSIVMSTFAGAALINGNYAYAVGVFLAASLLGILGFLFRDRILHKLEKKTP